MQAMVITAFHRAHPYGSTGKVVNERQPWLGPTDYEIEWPNGSRTWMSGYHVRVSNRLPDSRSPGDVENWLST